jgi:hypothetical protein
VNGFTGPLRIDYIDGTQWRIVEGFTYRVGDPNGEMFVQIPLGFVTDFASFPLGVLFKSPGGKWDKPAVIHDLLYQRGWIERSRHRVSLDRKDCDDIFKEAMQVAGVNWFARQMIYAGVRVGGWKPWDRYRKAEQRERDMEEVS